jgi:pteridine reductase
MSPRLALVTGGAVRLGEAISCTLATAGYQVIVHAFSNSARAAALAERIQGVALTADLCDRAAIDDLFHRVDGLHGHLEVLVNNAAIFERAAPEEVTADMWDRHLALNLTAPFRCAQLAAPRMRAAGRGVIVNVLDISATKPYRGYSHYSAAKAGLEALTRGLAAEWAPTIRVCGVAPGAALMPAWYSEAERATALERIPMKAEPGARAIADTVRFLVDGPAGITGEIIAVDGGRTTTW